MSEEISSTSPEVSGIFLEVGTPQPGFVVPFLTREYKKTDRKRQMALSTLNVRIGGQKLRPRVALLGTFASKDVELFIEMFPTIWKAPNIMDMERSVDVREIELTVIAPDVNEASDWPKKTHVVCFSRDIDRLPGPTPNTRLRIPGKAETEEFCFPDVPLPISRRRDADYGNLTSVRGWPRLELDYPPFLIGKPELETATTIFDRGAIIIERHTNSPLSAAFLRADTNLGVAWLPSVDINQAAWVELLVTQWAQCNKEAFPNFGDWTASPEWVVAEEEQILSQIQALEQKKQNFVVEIDKEIGGLTTKLALAKTNANNGLRRLITAQGEELVDEVAKALKVIGFNVTDMDELVGEKGSKKEDLRLRHIDKRGEEWTAIIEVRGYARSAGTTADLARLGRFANLYEKETGKPPDKRIYIVNGQLELLPSQRQEPLASATEDLEIFADSDGILIWSLDLFRVLKTTGSDYPAVLESIKHAKGRWVLKDVSPPRQDC